MNVTIRLFQPADREALLQIGAETAFFGEPIERYMEDRRIFMDAFYSAYTVFEPEHAWVACAGDRVVGFLTGCVDSARHAKTVRQSILPQVLGKLLGGKYHPGPKTWRYAFAVAAAALRQEIPAADLMQYPAHLHINILPDWRGHGLGKSLLGAYIHQLQELNITGVHLHTTNRNAAACRLYEKVGFQLLSARRTGMYAHLVGEPVENRCYGLRFKDGA